MTGLHGHGAIIHKAERPSGNWADLWLQPSVCLGAKANKGDQRIALFAQASEPRQGGIVHMAGYTIANIPTLYRGRMYRSRLEARWAAFFDRLGWAYEYEPFDLGTWSPDFAITKPFDALVEVKPITVWDDAVTRTAQKMVDAVKDAPLLVLTTVSPTCTKGVVIGWVGWFEGQGQWRFDGAGVIWRPRDDRPRMYADLFWKGDDEQYSATGPASNPDWSVGHTYPTHTMALWADATNAVQWEPRQ